MELSHRTNSGGGRPYCLKLDSMFSVLLRPLNTRKSISVPNAYAPRNAVVNKIDPVPTNGSKA
jgi:hypothetical protein